MQLPAITSSPQTRVRYGRYVARRLRRAKLTTLADDATSATNDLRTAARAWDDTDDATQEAIADRDAADDDLDVTAQEVRTSLAGRGINAAKEAPYTLIFPNGVSYYTAAPLDEETKRYGELAQRLTEHLPANDPARKKALKEIGPGIESFKAATASLEAARTAESLASTRVAKATDAWTKQMEKTYGALVSEVGRAQADLFFPRVNKKPKKAQPADKPDGAPA